MLGHLTEKQKEYMETKTKPARISTLDDFF
jgi:hypothetical protein